MPVSCPCTQDPKTAWSLELSEGALSRAFHVDAHLLKVAVRSTTGRALALSSGTHQLDAVTFRRVLGYDKVKSLGFTLTHAAEKLTLKGRGLGHGAGLCQIGAKVLAEQGWQAEKILDHYYPGATIQRMY